MKEQHQNKVELLGHYGGDLQHAMSAWTSTVRDIDEAKLGRMPALLKMLAENHHETPFEKSSLHFLVTSDIASHIHIIKHRIGVSVNGESARYKELKDDKYYVPQDWDDEEVNLYVEHMEGSLKSYHECLNRLVAKGVSRKRAKESARFFKTFNSQISLDIMFNFRSFVHFHRLRADEYAQTEVRELANEMLELIKGIEGNPFKHTLEAFKL